MPWAIDDADAGPDEEEALVVSAPAPSCTVLWHDAASDEFASIPDSSERIAIENCIRKLEVESFSLGFPHSSKVQGDNPVGVRELRPRQGRSRWRPLYVRCGESIFVILAVAPESEVDSAGYKRGVRLAQERAASIELD